jgi:hypothetical protein
MRAKEQKVQVFRRTQTFVGLLIGREEDPVAVAPAVGEVAEGAEPQQVGGGVEHAGILALQPRPGRHFLGDRTQTRILELLEQ